MQDVCPSIVITLLWFQPFHLTSSKPIRRVSSHTWDFLHSDDSIFVHIALWTLVHLFYGNILLLLIRIAVVGCHIQTLARIGSLGPGRGSCSHSGWVLLRPSDSRFSPELEAWNRGEASALTVVGCHWGSVTLDFRQNWKPGTREIPLLLTAVGCHWGPVILTSARIESLGPGRGPCSHCGWVLRRPSDSTFARLEAGERPLLSLWSGANEVQWLSSFARIGSPGPGRFPYSNCCVGRHRGPVIRTSARIGSPRPGRFPYSFREIVIFFTRKWFYKNLANWRDIWCQGMSRVCLAGEIFHWYD
jgi:hypothetical protein